MPIPERVYVPAAKDPGLGHFYISLIKSVVRIGAGISLALGGYYLGANDWGFWILIAGVAFVLAEILGIVEEIV